MTQPSNIIRLEGLVGLPARQAGFGRIDEAATGPAAADRLPAAGDEPGLGNVIPFTRLRGDRHHENAAPPVPGGTDRLAPAIAVSGRRAKILALVLGSAVVHGAVLATLNREPTPMASIGVEAISVEIVLDGPAEAETATTPTEAQSTPTESVTQSKAPEPTTSNEEVAVAPQDTKIEPAQPAKAADETPTAAAEPAPSEPVVAAIPPPQEAPTEPQHTLAPTKPPQQPAAEPSKKPSVPERPSNRARGKPSAATRPTSTRAAVASAANPANGAVPGRSDAETNYRGLAAAHLARFKQFPADARSRGDQGNSLVTFSIDGSGRVTKVALVRGTGVASLDQETQAMVRRASPFPPPPGGRAVTITAPVSFHLR